MRLGLGLGLSRTRRRRKSTKSYMTTFTCDGTDAGTKRMGFKRESLITVTGDLILTMGGIQITKGNPQTVPATGTSHHTFTLSGGQGTFTVDGRDVLSLTVRQTGNSITGDISHMQLTQYLTVRQTGNSITGDISHMQLTSYLYLWGTGNNITGDISNMQLTQYLYLYNTGDNITGDISHMQLTQYLHLRQIGTSITINSQPTWNWSSDNGMQITGSTEFNTIEEYQRFLKAGANADWTNNTRYFAMNGVQSFAESELPGFWGETVDGIFQLSDAGYDLVKLQGKLWAGSAPTMIVKGLNFQTGAGMPDGMWSWWQEQIGELQ